MIVKKITGELVEEAQLAYIVIIMFLLVIPFKYLDETKSQRWIRNLALDTREKIVIDLNYKTLHLIFNPRYEVILGLSGLLYGILFLEIEQGIVYLFLILPWFMYLNIRGVKYQVRPYLMDNYKQLFTFNLFSFLFFFLYFFSNLVIRLQNTLDILSSEMSDTGNPGISPVLLLIPGMIISVGLIGRIGMMTDILRQGQTQVGREMEKYIIDLEADSPDTLAIIDQQGVFQTEQAAGYSSVFNHPSVPDIYDFLKENKDRHLKLYCKIEECRSKDIRSFEICGTETFDKIQLESLVRFEYSSHNTITRLIDE